MNAKLSPVALRQITELDKDVQRHIVSALKGSLPDAGVQMVVRGMTCNLPDHIYRAFKFYAYAPGHRVIFHFVSPDTIVIDVVARRDCDPYGDGF